MRRLLAALLLALAVLGAGEAQAYEQSWIDAGTALTVAQATGDGWGADHCAGHAITVTIRAAAEMTYTDENGKLAQADGLAYTGGSCSMDIADTVDADRCRFIAVYAHELGHLWRDDGWHSDDRSNVMYTSGAGTEGAAACHAAGSTVTRAAAKRWVQGQLGSGWHLRVGGAATDPWGHQVYVVVTAKKGKRHGRWRHLRSWGVVAKDGVLSGWRL